jgi:hypothetical protein
MNVFPQRWLRGTLLRLDVEALALLILWIIFLRPTNARAQTQSQDITCDSGSGQYKTEFSTGTTIEVGPMRKGAFAERACSAKLVSKGQEVPVVEDAGQVGIDVLGADLGFGKPVVAFQIDRKGRGSNVVYQIYSLTKPAALLYTISGGNSYSAADTDLDGRVEIWTDDAAAVDGFEGLPKVDLDFAPTVVLRFEKGHLVDVGSEFISYYDALISKLRSQINQSDLAEFKQSDGRLSFSSLASGAKLHRQMRTKITVLEIVWAYIYSGRDKEAWIALDDLWPSQDVGRIRTAISDLYSRGILHNLEHSHRASSRKGRAKIYDTINSSPVVTNLNPYGGAPDPSQTEPTVLQPKSILLRRPPTSADGVFPSENETIELVVDAAGKVRSAKILKATDNPLVQASSGWHFIPAFHDGLPVACRFRLSVWALK